MRRLQDKKIIGHSIIENIVSYGYSKDEVYNILEKRLGINKKHTHFSNVQEMWQAKVVIMKLLEILDMAKQKYPNRDRVPNSSRLKPKFKSKQESLTLAEQREVLKQINNKPAGIWLRVKDFFC